ncbi:MAG: hypothetical protein IJT36_08175 [Alphaproteobacteria bacterium]|nr:hypothetical protein [Alphaproteobacteria bacterium]
MQILYAGILSIRDEKKQVLTEEMLVISVGREDRLPPPPTTTRWYSCRMA